jgi:hypothetical protein
MLGGRVRFEVSCEEAFDYLVEPANRPAWQSSLRGVEDVVGEPKVGQRWTDVTVPGLRPAMETTVFQRPTLWAESGTWRAVTARLRLGFTPRGAGCEVDVRFRITGPGVLGPVGMVLTAVSVPAVLLDVRHAAKILR